MVTMGPLSSFVVKGSRWFGAATRVLSRRFLEQKTISRGRPEHLQFEACSDRQQLILKAQSVRVTRSGNIVREAATSEH